MDSSEAMKVEHNVMHPGKNERQISKNENILSIMRQILPQVLVTTAKSSIILTSGMIQAFPIVLIGVLTSESNTGRLHFTLEQASWYGGLSYILQPLGLLVSGALLQPIGCKKLMILLNLPLFACWMLTYYASSVSDLYVTSALFGFVSGLIEVPAVRYIGEIAHPSLRSILTTYSMLFISIGCILIYSLASFTDWKHIALMSASVPIISIIALLWIPETPMWLMSKGRPREALKSLQLLRGHTPSNEVEEEFDKFIIYAKRKNSLQGFFGLRQMMHFFKDDAGDRQCLLSSRPKIYNGNARNVNEKLIRGNDGTDEYLEDNFWSEKWHQLTRRETLVPMSKGLLLFTGYFFCGMLPVTPYMIEIYDELKLPVNGAKMSAFQSFLNVVSFLLFMLIINRVGKKRLLLICCASTCLWLSLLSLSTHELLKGPKNEAGSNDSVAGWITLILFVLHTSTLSLGVRSIIWIYVSEIFPFKGRGVATGIIVSYFYIIFFLGVKFYPTLEQILHLDETFLMFAIVTIPFVIAIHFVIPETDGKFLADIESETTQRVRGRY